MINGVSGEIDVARRRANSNTVFRDVEHVAVFSIYDEVQCKVVNTISGGLSNGITRTLRKIAMSA